MTLLASEIRLLKAARQFIENGDTIESYGSRWEPHEISLNTAIDNCQKYFEGDDAAFRIANDRVSRRICAANNRNMFWSLKFLREIGYSYWREVPLETGGGKIVPGNVSEETFKNWKILANLAYIDRILETGEIK